MIAPFPQDRFSRPSRDPNSSDHVAFLSEASDSLAEASANSLEPFAFVAEPSAALAEAFAALAGAFAALAEAFAGLAEASGGLAEASALLAEPSAFVATCAAQRMADRPPPHKNAKRIASPAVRKKILDVIGKRLQPAERDDAMQRVYLRLMVMIDSLPEDDGELLGLVDTMASGKVVDQFRMNAVRDARHADEEDGAAVEEAAEVPTPGQLAEWKVLLVHAEKVVAEGLIPAETLERAQRLAQGETYEDIADDVGLPAATVRKRMERARKILRAHWRKTTGITGAILGAVLLFLWLRRPTTPEIIPEAYVPTPSATTAPAVETPPQKVTRLRAEAQAACDGKKYEQCETLLDQAGEIDRDSEARPDVVKLRKAINDWRFPPKGPK